MILIHVQLLINAAFHQWTQFCLQTLAFGQILAQIKRKKKNPNKMYFGSSLYNITEL